MIRRRKLPIALVLAALLLAPAITAGSNAAADETTQESIRSPLVMVRIKRLTGIGTDNRERVLFESRRGAVLPLFDLSQLGERIGTTGLPPNGVYRNLRAELDDEIILLNHGLKRVRKPLRGDARTTTVGVRGEVVIDGVNIRSQGLALEPAAAHAVAFATLNKSKTAD